MIILPCIPDILKVLAAVAASDGCNLIESAGHECDPSHLGVEADRTGLFGEAT
jgi:hypothetical protein